MNKLTMTYCTAKGKRQYMEDFVFFSNSNTYLLTGIVDGHGGKNCALFIKNNFVNIFKLIMKKQGNDIKMSLYTTCIQLQKFILDKKFTKSGTTCNIIVIDKQTNKIYACNIGDSRAILCDNNNHIHQITKDHSLTDPAEYAMVYNHNGFVQDNRVNGILSTSRAFGDIDLAPYMSAVPDIYEKHNNYTQFIVQSSDGLLDVMSNKKICNFISNQLNLGYALNTICNNLVEHALNNEGAVDNLSVIIILFS